MSAHEKAHTRICGTSRARCDIDIERFLRRRLEEWENRSWRWMSVWAVG